MQNPRKLDLPCANLKMFVDWRPYATASIRPFVVAGKRVKSPKEFEEFFEGIEGYKAAVQFCVEWFGYSYRTDGLFVFFFAVADPKGDVDVAQKVERGAELLSHLIKYKLGHRHLFHRGPEQTIKDDRKFFLARRPVPIPNFLLDEEIKSAARTLRMHWRRFHGDTFEKSLLKIIEQTLDIEDDRTFVAVVDEVLGDDTLLGLMPYVGRKEDPRFALLKIRLEFSQMFDELFDIMRIRRLSPFLQLLPPIITATVFYPLLVPWCFFALYLSPLWDDLLMAASINLAGAILLVTIFEKVRKSIWPRTKIFRHWENRGRWAIRVLKGRRFEELLLSIYILIYPFAFFGAVPFYEIFSDIIKVGFPDSFSGTLEIPFPRLYEYGEMLKNGFGFIGFATFFTGFGLCCYIEFGFKRSYFARQLRNTRGALIFGNVYTRVVERLYFDYRFLGLVTSARLDTGGFVDAVRVIDHVLGVEESKRITRKPWYILIGVAVSVGLVGYAVYWFALVRGVEFGFVFP